ELLHVQHYVELLNYRYPDRFELICKIDEELLNKTVMKLLLQPIVENAIYHGLDDLNETMVITIRSELRQQQLALIISDNGIGIDEQRLAALNAGLRANSSSDDGDRKDAGEIGRASCREGV